MDVAVVHGQQDLVQFYSRYFGFGKSDGIAL